MPRQGNSGSETGSLLVLANILLTVFDPHLVLSILGMLTTTKLQPLVGIPYFKNGNLNKSSVETDGLRLSLI